MKLKYLSAYVDGTLEDEQNLEAIAENRRRNLTVQQALDKVLLYLMQAIDVLDIDIKRYKKDKNGDDWQHAVARRQWAESMIFWINHNV